MPIPQLKRADGVTAEGFDAVVLVTAATSPDAIPEPFQSTVTEAAKVDKTVLKSVTVHVDKGVAGSRLIVSPTGPLNRGYDDVRRIGDAAGAGVARAVKAGAVAPILVFTSDTNGPKGFEERYTKSFEVGVLGALQVCWLPDVQGSAPEVRLTQC